MLCAAHHFETLQHILDTTLDVTDDVPAGRAQDELCYAMVRFLHAHSLRSADHHATEGIGYFGEALLKCCLDTSRHFVVRAL